LLLFARNRHPVYAALRSLQAIDAAVFAIEARLDPTGWMCRFCYAVIRVQACSSLDFATVWGNSCRAKYKRALPIRKDSFYMERSVVFSVRSNGSQGLWEVCIERILLNHALRIKE
jgi:hypothetical protein